MSPIALAALAFLAGVWGLPTVVVLACCVAHLRDLADEMTLRSPARVLGEIALAVTVSPFALATVAYEEMTA